MAATTPYTIDLVEGETKTYSTILLDEDSNPVLAAAYTGVRLTLYSVDTGAIVNTRSNIDILNNAAFPEFTVDAVTGEILLKFEEDDVLIIDSPKPTSVRHRAVVVLEWDDGDSISRQMIREINLVITRADNAPFSA